MSALAADEVLFNSAYNQASFLEGLADVFRHVPREQQALFGLREARAAVAARARVLAFPVRLPRLPQPSPRAAAAPLHLLWNHRWEWDKGPAAFFTALRSLADRSLPFVVSVVGESGATADASFAAAKEWLEAEGRLVHWGRLPGAAYRQLLVDADVVVSTALHEFFGVSVVEAVQAGCWPLCPERLAFPCHLPRAHGGLPCLYRTQAQLEKALRQFAACPARLRAAAPPDLSHLSFESLMPQYAALLRPAPAADAQ
mmetsp:Transcript_1073/g.3850  ORF Transcript_1073/g.3850 Transcript_1073/m.3850 type:complete len:257 (-) Transcript_1073:39-809(-)